MKVYLSGGMYGNWQDKVPIINGVEYFDPREQSPQTSCMDFVKVDMDAVRNSDVVFCFIEENNPSGLGAAFECAIAYENKIPIITVWEKDYIDPFFACTSLFLYKNLDNGLDRLKKYLKSNLK